MIDSIERRARPPLAVGSRESVFDLWHAVYLDGRAGTKRVAPLLAGFGVSLVERAAIDAFCRAGNVPFAEAMRSTPRSAPGSDAPGVDGPRSAGAPAVAAPDRIRIRHTVGLAMRLPGRRGATGPADGLPASLEACIRRYGLRRFKVKVRGRPLTPTSPARADPRRARTGDRWGLPRHARRKRAVRRTRPRCGLSGMNWRANAPTAELAARVDYVEQPLPRHAVARRGDRGEPRRVARASPRDHRRGRTTRWTLSPGQSRRATTAAFKSCKGVFKGLGNACRIEQLRRQHPGRAFVYSAEDLSTIGPVCLLADLAVIATLGIDEPERNGYHYLRDLTSLSPRVEQETMRCHPDLYAAQADGHPVLDITDGGIKAGSVVAAPFGVGWPCDIEEELPSAESLLASLAAEADKT